MMGAGALVSGGVSAAAQKAESGTVEWGRVGVDAAVGALAGGLGAGTGAVIASRMGTGLTARAATAAAGGVAEGGASGGASYAMSEGPHTPSGFVQATATGAAVGAATGGITGYKPKWLPRDVAENFQHGLYRSGYIRQPTTLYRAGDFNKSFNGEHMGEYWSTDKPISIAAVRSEKALPPAWSDGAVVTLNHGYSAGFGAMTPRYTGLVAPQRGPSGEIYRGGTNQTYIPEAWNHGHETGSWELVD